MKKIDEVLLDTAEFKVLIFDVRIPGIADKFHEARAFYQEKADVVTPDENHYVLLVQSAQGWRHA